MEQRRAVRQQRWMLLIPILLLLLIGGGLSLPATSPTWAQSGVPNLTPDQAALLARLRQTGSLRLMVRLNVNFQPEARLSTTQTQTQRSQIRQSERQALNALAGTAFTAHTRFDTLPYTVVTVDEPGFLRLIASPAVARLFEDEVLRIELAQATPLIGANDAWAAGYAGSGYAVAILDSGTESSHPFLSGKVKSEACYSLADAQQGLLSACPNGQPQQLGTGAAAPPMFPAGSTERTLWTHGTHVAGIAAGKGQNFSGVARDADIIAIQVGSQFTAQMCTQLYGAPLQSCPAIPLSNFVKGLERVYALRNDFQIAAVNLSLGGGSLESYCDAISPATEAVQQLVAVNIAVIAATGNNGYSQSIAHPACISSVVAVSATNKNDTMASSLFSGIFANNSQLTDLLAPGAGINSSVIGGGFQAQDGTSMAAPMVAGAWAVLRSARPSATVEEILQALRTTGKLITDPRNNISRPRINVKAAADALKGGQPVVRRVVINEIRVQGTNAIELFNADTRSANLNGWKALIFSSTGTLVKDYTINGLTLPSKGYLVLHQGTGTDNATNRYMGNYDAGWASGGSGAVRLTNGATAIDFVRWGDSTVDPGPLTAFTDVNPPGPPASLNIGRDEFSTDLDTATDWTVMARTLGAQNVVTRPPNDLPGGALALDTLPFNQVLNIRNATRTGEPTPTCAPDIANTVWYRYQTTQARTITIRTTGTNFDTVLAVYTGIGGTPTQLACNDDITPGLNVASLIVLNAQPGVTYHIMAGANGPMSGYLRLTVTEGSFHDELVAARQITALPYQDVDDISLATYNPSDPNSACTFGVLFYLTGPTVWYRYTPASNHRLRLDTRDSTLESVIAVFTGAPGALTEVVCSNLFANQVELNVTAGTQYSIMIINMNEWVGTSGTVLNLKAGQVGSPTPTPTSLPPTPTSTPTPTMTPTPITPTPGTPTPTPTPGTPTPTPEPDDDLLTNGGFEQPGALPRLAERWIDTNLTNDRRRCNAANPAFAYEGGCVFIFTGQPGQVSTIHQVIREGISPGDVLTVSFWARAANLSGNARVQVRVRYTDGTPQTIRNLRITNGSYGYRSYEGVVTVADAPVRDVRVMVRMANGGGAFRIDALSLRRAATLPLPGGYRGQ